MENRSIFKSNRLEHIVLETDAPYLSPVPFRGKRNESSYILNVLEKLSDIYEVSKDKIAELPPKIQNLFLKNNPNETSNLIDLYRWYYWDD